MILGHGVTGQGQLCPPPPCEGMPRFALSRVSVSKLLVSSGQLKINLRGGKWPAPWFLVANFIKPFERNFVVLTLILFVSTYVLNIR